MHSLNSKLGLSESFVFKSQLPVTLVVGLTAQYYFHLTIFKLSHYPLAIWLIPAFKEKVLFYTAAC